MNPMNLTNPGKAARAVYRDSLKTAKRHIRQTANARYTTLLNEGMDPEEARIRAEEEAADAFTDAKEEARLEARDAAADWKWANK